MAKNQNTFAKRQREMAKKQKAEDKRARRKQQKQAKDENDTILSPDAEAKTPADESPVGDEVN